MKKTILCITLGFITSYMHAQLSQQVIKNFPAQIVYKLQELTQKMPIDEAKQIQIAKRLVANDSVANTKKMGLDFDALSAYYTINKKTLDGILDILEMEQFLYLQDPENRFLRALVMAPELRLNAEQIVAIRKENDLLPTKPKNINTQSYYCKQLQPILDTKQYVSLTRSMYKDIAKIKAQKDWKAIQKLKVMHEADTAKAYKNLYNFHTMLEALLDEKAEKYSPKIYESVKARFTLDKQPLFLMHKNIIEQDLYYKNLFAIALRNQEFLKLSLPQTDSLLVKCKEIELLKIKGKDLVSIGVFPFENEHLTKILDVKQYKSLLAKRYENEAQKFALDSWDALEKENLTEGLDKKNTIRDFRVYKVNSLVINYIIKFDKNQVNMFMRRDIELKKPELLQKLEALNQTNKTTKTTKNNLKW